MTRTGSRSSRINSAGRAAVLVAAIFLVVAVAAQTKADAPKGKNRCMHCKAIGAEMQRRLEAERPRNHIDLRHRLDSKGQRYGKVIDYKVSELRAVELLDGLCASMNHYELMYLQGNETEAGHKGWNWIKVKGAGKQAGIESKFEIQKQEMKSRQIDLESYCGRVMEQHEERLEHAITGGEFEKVSVTEYLCMRSLKVCKLEEDEQQQQQQAKEEL